MEKIFLLLSLMMAFCQVADAKEPKSVIDALAEVGFHPLTKLDGGLLLFYRNTKNRGTVKVWGPSVIVNQYGKCQVRREEEVLKYNIETLLVFYAVDPKEEDQLRAIKIKDWAKVGPYGLVFANEKPAILPDSETLKLMNKHLKEGDSSRFFVKGPANGKVRFSVYLNNERLDSVPDTYASSPVSEDKQVRNLRDMHCPKPEKFLPNSVVQEASFVSPDLAPPAPITSAQ